MCDRNQIRIFAYLTNLYFLTINKQIICIQSSIPPTDTLSITTDITIDFVYLSEPFSVIASELSNLWLRYRLMNTVKANLKVCAVVNASYVVLRPYREFKLNKWVCLFWTVLSHKNAILHVTFPRISYSQ